ncbi:MBL fold metallo-hydrolase [Micrococcus sp. HG099]|uniref:Glyoxylase-like metal-dependent hydrolase (Beta-lactamase superfamily II) n=1 Tax=Micrococcus endophyticus TaxID=455343 RepID=A0A7W9JIA3_9MICC|nr:MULTISPECIES: MBL fold metallo-hydrolase [Micrococcus]MBB5848183.1 glyoxylase-like metal-dependent hydrolase (beta-lactamase superfamily II) [Micrococcus endophyticus]MCK6090369.1 MBL fold metallo-hydrolase [Micrococcus endophyticus]MCR8674908.1 MBL fold metallo-hydrolase [Micrococcus sp. HG099]
MPATVENRLLHDLPAVTVRACSVSKMDNNVYLLTAKTTGAQVLIDAADDAEAIEALLASAEGDTPCATRLAVVVTTHRHWDHVRALGTIAAAHPEAVLAAGEDDADAIEEEAGVRIGDRLPHGGVVAVDGIELDVIGLRGHTPGSVALAYRSDAEEPALLFTGDSLFPGGVGNTEKDPERFASLIDDVEARLFGEYEDDTHVHPGHGASTVLGDERPQLPAWRDRGW